MAIRLLRGDARELLATLPGCSVQACLTSPPYFGLRDYGTPPLVWGGDAGHGHEFGPEVPGDNRGGSGTFNGRNGYGEGYGRDAGRGGFCVCGAWLGSHGLEPTPELYIEHEVEVFRQVRRVLRDDGVLWINLGDSYAGSGKGPTGHNGIQAEASCIGSPERGLLSNRRVSGARGSAGPATAGYKAKDLMMMPARVALALQADGWYLRSMLPWLKRNSMPESVTDRPANAVEYWFLFSKSARYFWDADAVRQPSQPMPLSAVNKSDWYPRKKDGVARESFRMDTREYNPNGRAFRNSELFFQTWQGLLLNEEDEPLALLVNPAPYKGAHYATFPPKVLEPLIKASTRPGDTVFDPFAGSGTVGLVADRLGREAILCEQKHDYTVQAFNRVTDDAPMFVQVEMAV